jgi:nucleoside-diphosphate-sugar epimerase
VRFFGQQTTVDTARARTELGFRPASRWPEGLFSLHPLG